MQALNMLWFSECYPNSAAIYVTFNDDQWVIACDEVCDYGRYGGTQRGETGSGVKAAVARRIVHRVLTARGVSDGLAKEVAAMWAPQGAQCLMEVVDWALGPKGLDIDAAACKRDGHPTLLLCIDELLKYGIQCCPQSPSLDAEAYLRKILANALRALMEDYSSNYEGRGIRLSVAAHHCVDLSNPGPGQLEHRLSAPAASAAAAVHAAGHV